MQSRIVGRDSVRTKARSGTHVGASPEMQSRIVGRDLAAQNDDEQCFRRVLGGENPLVFAIQNDKRPALGRFRPLTGEWEYY